MKLIKTIAAFEFKMVASKKSWYVTTIIMALITFTLFFVPRIITLFNPQNELFGTPQETTTEEIAEDSPGIYINTGQIKASALSKYFNNQITLFSNESDLVSAIEKETVPFGFIILSDSSFEIVRRTKNNSPYGNYEDQIMIDFLKHHQKSKFLTSKGIVPEEFFSIESSPIESSQRILQSNSSGNYTTAYIVMFMIYFLVLFYGSIVATSVAKEKSNRTMELLITSTKPKYLLFGKIIGVSLVGLLQFSIIILSGVLSYFINKSTLPFDLGELINMDMQSLIYLIIFVLLGYFLYLCIYAMLGSTVSKIEEVQSAVSPITILLVFAFIGTQTAMGAAPNSMFMKVLSFIPFTSPLAMFARINMVGVPALQIAFSILILLVTTIAFGLIASKIYRRGTLNYGKKLSLIEMIKSVKE